MRLFRYHILGYWLVSKLLGSMNWGARLHRLIRFTLQAIIFLSQPNILLVVCYCNLIQNPASIRWMGLLERASMESGGRQALRQIMCFEPSKFGDMLTAIKRGEVSQVLWFGYKYLCWTQLLWIRCLVQRSCKGQYIPRYCSCRTYPLRHAHCSPLSVPACIFCQQEWKSIILVPSAGCVIRHAEGSYRTEVSGITPASQKFHQPHHVMLWSYNAKSECNKSLYVCYLTVLQCRMFLSQRHGPLPDIDSELAKLAYSKRAHTGTDLDKRLTRSCLFPVYEAGHWPHQIPSMDAKANHTCNFLQNKSSDNYYAWLFHWSVLWCLQP